jgi:hypothetical protein
MGSQKCRNVGKYQSLLIMITPIIPPRTRSLLRPASGEETPRRRTDRHTGRQFGGRQAVALACRLVVHRHLAQHLGEQRRRLLLLTRRARVALGTATQCTRRNDSPSSSPPPPPPPPPSCVRATAATAVDSSSSRARTSGATPPAATAGPWASAPTAAAAAASGPARRLTIEDAATAPGADIVHCFFALRRRLLPWPPFTSSRSRWMISCSGNRASSRRVRSTARKCHDSHVRHRQRPTVFRVIGLQHRRR